MRDPELFNRYAVALLELSVELNKVEEYRSQVKIIRNLLKENDDFEHVLNDARKDLDTKFAIIDKVFKDFNENIISFIKIIVRNKRAMCLYEIFRETLFRFDDYLHIEEGNLYLASKMDQESIDRIIESIEKQEGISLELEVNIDPSILGGFVVELKNNVYDSSVRSKLDNLKASLLGGKKDAN